MQRRAADASRTLVALVALVVGAAGCATSSPPPVPSAAETAPLHARQPGAERGRVSAPGVGTHAARSARSMIGAPYRYGGASPRGFDCSGLVIHSYAAAGIRGLPHSAAELERVSRPVSMHELEPGDLLFFRLSSKKTSHVAIYVGNRSFVHAPSSGKSVEQVRFDDVYWASRLGRAGRIRH